MTLNKKDQSRLHGYKNEARSTPQFSDDTIKQALQEAAEGRSGQLTRSQYQLYYDTRRGVVPHPFTVIRRFGRWNAGLEAAGLPVVKRSDYRKHHNDALCIEALQECRKRLGHLPSVLEYNRVWHEGYGKAPPLRDEGYPSEATIRSRFGRWRTALNKAVKDEE